jgi:hypothetical protein
MNYPDKTDNCEGRVYISDRLETENNGEPAPTLTGECELSPPEAYSPLLSELTVLLNPEAAVFFASLGSYEGQRNNTKTQQQIFV